MIRQVTHAWLVLLLLVVMLPAAATENTAATENSKEPYEPGTGQYLLVLIDGATGVRDSKTGKKAHEPDVAKLGGKLLEKKDNVRLIKLPVAAAKALRKEENVAYIQRIWRGEPLEDLDDEQGASSAGPRVQTDMATDLTWETGQYLYDGSGNIKKIGNDEYSYDSAGRLIQAKVKGTVETYKYDSFGNLVEKSRGGATGAINVDATSNRLTGETYDAAGNARTRNGQPWYTYDSLNMMDTTRVDEITTRRILYGPDDERIAVIHDQGLARWKIRDFEGRVLREFKDDVGSTWHWMEDYVHGEGRILGAEREEYYLGRRHMHTDHLGSVRLMTMQDRTQISGHDFYPFGEEQTDLNYEYTTWMTPGDGGNARPEPMKYTGHERDFHGWYNVPNNDYLDYMHARYYDPNRGRFLSVDPLLGDVTNPQSWNRYAYALANPVLLRDPDGRAAILSFGQDGFYWGDDGDDNGTADDQELKWYAVVLKDEHGIPTHEAIVGYANGVPSRVYEHSANWDAPRENIPFDQSLASKYQPVARRYLGFDPATVAFNERLNPYFKARQLQCSDYAEFMQKRRFPAPREVFVTVRVHLQDRVKRTFLQQYALGHYFYRFSGGYQPVNGDW